ncbi:MAG TPA: T9SS type A sorting domain-containing protein [Bacteroidia bacterium]|jgi:hypothetical protein|nr:T9SS type A sorting domain-containing protein [Bacteroidia bacterium]
MKHILTLLVVFTTGILCKSQNGLQKHPIPVGSYPHQNRTKNDVAIDNNSNKWVCFSSDGLGKFDGTNWTMYNPGNSPLPSYYTDCIAFDATNKAWIGTDSGAVSFDGTNWVRYSTTNSGIASNRVISVSVTGGQIIFGTIRGISIFNGSNWTSYATSNSGLISDTVNAITMESSGALWAATSRGVSRLQGTSWTSFTNGNSALRELIMYSIYIDAQGDKWVGSSSNVYRISGNMVTPLQAISPELSYGFHPFYSFCKGPHGGVAFGYAINGSSGIHEVGWPKDYLYQIPSPKYVCYENSTGKIWFTTFQGDTSLYSFDASQYNPAWLGLNYDNFKDLDINEVRAPVTTRGDMHWDGYSAGYEVPKGSGKHADFAAALWIGGMDQSGTLHQAAMTYRQHGYDYWPGPLDTITGTSDSVKASAYDKVWKVDRYQIEEFKYYFQKGQVQNGSYVPAEDILTWPAKGQGDFSRNLAPFVDVNHNGIYDPLTGGDYPVIRGDQELYRIFNDQLAPHTETGGAPLQVEVHASAYAYVCPTIADSNKVLNYTTFYHYDIFNRSAQNYTKAYVAGWQDVDLGKYDDDMVGCNPEGNYGYVYNGTPCDGTGTPGQYGCKPPMMSTVILSGPLAVAGDGIDNNNNGTIDEPGEQNLMTCFHYYDNDFSATGNPGDPGFPGSTPAHRPMDYYNYMLGKWCDSTYVTYGGRGYGGSTPTRFMYPSFPYDTSGWSEYTSHDTPGDRRFLLGCGPFDFHAGSQVSFDYALVFTRDTTLAPQSPAFFQKNASDNKKVQNWFAQNNAPSCMNVNVGIEESKPSVEQLDVFPNPFTGELNISFASGTAEYNAEVLDLTGKSILQFTHLTSGPHVLNLSGLADGMYFLKVSDAKGFSCRKIIRQ